MEGKAKNLVEILNGGAGINFVIPVFQRNYAWTIRNCEQLYNDLNKIITEQRENHFFGGIVSVLKSDGGTTEYQIIDGQQRLTTTTLLILAMYKLVKQGRVRFKDSKTLEKKLYYYLYEPLSEKPKLHPNKKDQQAFEALFDERAEHIKTSNLTDNYNFFYERIQKSTITIDQLLEAISKLKIINIILAPEDKPQLVFESLNSTGLDLSESDKIRNYLLMDLKEQQQEDYYHKYWEPIEDNTEGNLDAFIRDYLSVKQGKTPTIGKVYFAFKKYAKEQNLKVDDLLPDLRKYSRFYSILLGKDKIKDHRISACIYRLNRLETTVVRPFFLEVLRLQKEGIITLDETFQIFRITENYLFRRSICDIPTYTLNKTFLKLHSVIEHFERTQDNYLEKFKCALLMKQDKYRFPDDEEFMQLFSTRQVYKMASKTKDYIFERLENDGTKEDKDVYQHLDADDDNDKYTIEHIMPQTLTPVWKAELGKDYEEIHKTWLHRIANLTLTAYNPNLSNHSFKEKCSSKNGYQKSGIRMNQQIAQNTHWGKDELIKRNEELIQVALKIWEFPQTNYKPQQNELELESYTLEDDINLAGKKIVKFVYKEKEQAAKEWLDMFKDILGQLHSENKAVLYSLSQKGNKEKYSNYFSNNSNTFKNYFEIDTDLYCRRITNTPTKIRILRHLFKIFVVDLDELEIYVRNEKEDKSND